MTTRPAADRLPEQSKRDASPWPEPNTWHARGGRLSAGKRRALADLLPRWAPPSSPAPLLTSDAGTTTRPEFATLAIEIGAGSGEAALALAADRPDLLVIASDTHAASLATFLRRAEASQPLNLCVAAGDGRALLPRVDPSTLRLVRAFFPDPWPKRRQRHRRLVQLSFVELAARCTVEGAVVELCTDDAAYAAHMVATFQAAPVPWFEGGPTTRAERPVTHYERLAREAGRPVIDLRYVRTAAPAAKLEPQWTPIASE